MASAIDASASTVQTPTTAAANSNNSIQQLGKDLSQFLTLLTTQLQNQDPLSPLDTNAFTQQLIGFSQVEQQINTNTKLDGLVALGSSNNLSTSLGYVGLNINYLSSEFNFDGSTAVQSHYVLASAAASNKMAMSFINKQAQPIRTIMNLTGTAKKLAEEKRRRELIL